MQNTPTYSIEKEFHFSAGHFLRDYDGPCSQLHGHNYVVVLVLQSEELVGPGFVREFRELDEFKRYLDETLDHKTLNDVEPFTTLNPTTENLARHLFEVACALFSEITEIRVSETPKTWVRYFVT